MTSAFRVRQGNGMGQLMADMQQGIQDGNQALTDTEGLLNDATEATEGMANQFIGQGLNAAGQFTGAAVGGNRLQLKQFSQNPDEFAAWTLSYITNGRRPLEESDDNASLLVNNELRDSEEVPEIPDYSEEDSGNRVQQSTAGNVAQGTSDVTNDSTGISNNGIGAINNLLDQTNQALNQILGTSAGAVTGPATTTTRRLQSLH
ncbi:unnamed protein product [Moneuplotes crassus]|uniref:Uncharacterized protein n=1 Tax=Euplotes crassus TaxID=5936 RepID=A0AAD1UFY1_EUPCR|nr:unnamed protein product [Moneuplotes crassus]